MFAGLPGEDVDNPEKGDATEGVVTPLIGGLDESTSESGDNHDLVNQDEEKDGGPWHASGKKQIHKEQRRGNDPVNVSLGV